MKKVFFFLVSAAIVIGIVNSCGSTSNTSYPKQPNYSYLYNPASTRLHPVVQVYHVNDSFSDLTIKLFPDELLFNKANSKGIMLASVTISYTLYEVNKNGTLSDHLADSAMLKNEIEQDEVNKRYFINTSIKAKRGKNYYLTLKVRDNHRNAMATKFLNVIKENSLGPQNYKVLYKRNGQEVFEPKVIGNEDVRLYYTNNEIEKVYVKYYNNYQVDPPPVNIMVVEPSVYTKYDSIFTLDYNGHVDFAFRKKGMYLIQVDTAFEEGIALIRFHDEFPKIEDQEQLARPLLYLQSDIKYKEMLNAKNMKLEVDNFWLKLSGDNTEKARQLVRVYYNRVFFANYYFTSYKEGWMTDRGMVFIIYGQPDIIHKDPDKEEWIYLGKNMNKVLSFQFIRMDNAFSINHYTLKRADGANTYWREAMISWQGGNVFSLDNLKL